MQKAPPKEVLFLCLITNRQPAAVISGVVLDQGEYRSSVGGEVGNHVWLADDDLSIQDIVVCVVAMVDDKGEIHNHSRGVALTVGAGVRFVGRHTVVCQKLCVAHSVDDDASAGAFHVGGDVEPTAHEVQLLVLHGVGVNGNRCRQDRPIGILGTGRASMDERLEPH